MNRFVYWAVGLVLTASVVTCNSCPHGQVWVTEQSACRGRTPTMQGRPMITYPMIVDRKRVTSADNPDITREVTKFGFKCIIEGYTKQSTDDGARFDVTFLFDWDILDISQPNFGEEPRVPVFTTDSTTLEVQLDEKYLYGRMGKTVSCRVQSYWNGNNAEKSDPLLAWNGFWAGVKQVPEEEKQTVNEVDTKDGPFSVDIKSTVPITCWNCSGRDIENCCEYDLVINDGNYRPDCKLTFTEEETTKTLDYEIVVTEGIRPPGTQVKIKFNSFAPNLQKPYPLQRYVVDSINIEIVDEIPAGQCSLVTDPHITTFDSKFYEAFRPGDYHLVLYEPFTEIQGRFKPCGSASCTCGVIIRERNDVIGIDQCDGNTPRVVQHLVDETVTKRPEITRANNGREITVIMPSGVRVRTYRWSSLTISAYIYAPSSYKNRQGLGGLCGNYNGDPDDDLTLRDSDRVDDNYRPIDFKDSWKIDDDDNYFKKRPTCKEFREPPEWLCQCNKDTNSAVCEHPAGGRHISPLTPAGGVPTCRGSTMVKRHAPLGYGTKRARRSPGQFEDGFGDDVIDLEDLYKDYGYDPDHGVNVPTDFPSESGITRAQAQTRCEAEIHQSPIYQYCQGEIAADKLETVVGECLSDVLLLDDLDAATGFGSELEASCIFAIQAAQNIPDSEMVQDEETGEFLPKEVKQLRQAVCPNQCSGSGQCRNGTCECDAGFAAVDCSVDTTMPPVLTGIQSSLCDIRTRSCLQTRLYGSNILDSNNLLCDVSTETAFETKLVQEETSATYISSEELVCDLPQSPVHKPPEVKMSIAPSTTAVQHTWTISISNDGNRHSDPIRMMVYDSLCQNCTGIGSCAHKAGTCNIQQVCYDDLDLNPDNLCQQCHPQRSTGNWGDIENNENPVMETDELTKVRDQILSTQLKAMDPEGQAITFLLISGQSVTVTETGWLEWSADHNEDQQIVVQLDDECGGRSAEFVQLRVIEEDTTEPIGVTGTTEPIKPSGTAESITDDSVNKWMIATITLAAALAAVIIITVSVCLVKKFTNPNKVTDSYEDLMRAQEKGSRLSGSLPSVASSRGGSTVRSWTTPVSVTSHK